MLTFFLSDFILTNNIHVSLKVADDAINFLKFKIVLDKTSNVIKKDDRQCLQ